MKALSLTQPWASLVAVGAKRIETRSWATAYRGPLAIHASKGFPKWAKETCFEEPFLSALYPDGYSPALDPLPTGAVIATARLADCLPMESFRCLAGIFDEYPELETPQELVFGDFSLGRWAWVLEDVKVIEPVLAKGSLGLWEWNQ